MRLPPLSASSSSFSWHAVLPEEEGGQQILSPFRWGVTERGVRQKTRSERSPPACGCCGLGVGNKKPETGRARARARALPLPRRQHHTSSKPHPSSLYSTTLIQREGTENKEQIEAGRRKRTGTRGGGAARKRDVPLFLFFVFFFNNTLLRLFVLFFSIFPVFLPNFIGHRPPGGGLRAVRPRPGNMLRRVWNDQWLRAQLACLRIFGLRGARIDALRA